MLVSAKALLVMPCFIVRRAGPSGLRHISGPPSGGNKRLKSSLVLSDRGSGLNCPSLYIRCLFLQEPRTLYSYISALSALARSFVSVLLCSGTGTLG